MINYLCQIINHLFIRFVEIMLKMDEVKIAKSNLFRKINKFK